jgi:hypothetical protein
VTDTTDTPRAPEPADPSEITDVDEWRRRERLRRLLVAADDALPDLIPVFQPFVKAVRETWRAPFKAPTFDDRIDEAARLLAKASGMVRELETEMVVRRTTLNQLREDAETYERLAAANQEEARVVTDYIAALNDTRDKRANKLAWKLFWWTVIITAIVAAGVTIGVTLWLV